MCFYHFRFGADANRCTKTGCTYNAPSRVRSAQVYTDGMPDYGQNNQQADDSDEPSLGELTAQAYAMTGN